MVSVPLRRRYIALVFWHVEKQRTKIFGIGKKKLIFFRITWNIARLMLTALYKPRILRKRSHICEFLYMCVCVCVKIQWYTMRTNVTLYLSYKTNRRASSLVPDPSRVREKRENNIFRSSSSFRGFRGRRSRKVSAHATVESKSLLYPCCDAYTTTTIPVPPLQGCGDPR